MKLKKNSFFAFCFSLIPGAAHMYMGFMKQGMSIMILLTLNIAIAVLLNLSVVTIVIPIIWFYAFFDAHHKRALPAEEFHKLEDKSLFSDFTGEDIINLTKGKSRPILAGFLIFLGCYIIYNYIVESISRFLPSYAYYGYYYILNRLPQVLVAILIIYIGYKLIKGKKIELEDNSNNYKKDTSSTSNAVDNVVDNREYSKYMDYSREFDQSSEVKANYKDIKPDYNDTSDRNVESMNEINVIDDKMFSKEYSIQAAELKAGEGNE